MARRSRGLRSLAAIVFVLVIEALAPLSPSHAASAIVGPLYTSGNQIFDGSGNPLILRGVNNAVLHKDPTIVGAPSLTEASFDAMHRWGVNQVRVALGQQFWLKTECKYSANYVNNVDTVVNRITSRGMVVMLSLARVTRKPCHAAKPARMADQRSLEFWRQVAARYMSNPLVTFDLYNEPHRITWNQWKYGGTLKDGSLTWKAAGMQQLYDAVRSTGAQNLVYVSGNQWGARHPDDSYLLSGYNIVYATHRYTCPHYPPPKCKKSNPYNPAPPGKRLNLWVPLIATHPVQITEFGWPAQNSKTYNQNVIDWAESHGIGWTAHAWAANSRFFSLLTDWVTWNPTPAGVPVRDGVALNR